MNVMELLTGSAAQAIGWALLHLLWQATIVAGILAAVLALIPRESANARYVASCGALALVFAMFVTTAIRSYDPAAAPVAMTASSSDAKIDIPLSRVPVIIVATAAASWRDRAIDAVATARQSLPIVVALWFVGVLFLSTRLLVSWLRARALVTRGATVASIEWQRVAARLSHALGLRRAVRLLESAAVEVPSVLGTLRPVILLPASTLTGLTPEQLEMVLAHELAHIRRHDFLMNLLQAFVETLMFYHPAVWWMSRRVRIERENCCDDLAVAVCGNPIQYARALTRLEELRAEALPVVVAANGGSLLDRVRRIAAGRAESTGVSSRWAAALATLAILGAALAVPSLPALAQRDTQKSTAQPKTASSTMNVVEPVNPTEAAEPVEADDRDVEAHEPGEQNEPEPEPEPVELNEPQPLPNVAPAPVVLSAMHLNPPDDDDRDDDDRDAKQGGDKNLSIDDIIELRAVGVTPDYIETMRALFPNASMRQITEMRAVGVTREFVTQMRGAGLTVNSAREATELRAVSVTPQFVQQMRDAGFAVNSAREATELRAVGVTPDYISDMRKAGFAVSTVREATELRAVGVNPEFIAEMRSAGFPVRSAHEAAELRAVGVTSDYVRSMRDAGVKITSARDIANLRAVGVTAEFVRKLAAAGYTDLSVRQLTGMAAYGVDGDFLRDMQKYRTQH
ncbi:MAG: M48 family metalloprotease [Acidobacteriota bacterium]|nr:M48 family metalloprotease [Acidobacteriota bacterium]